MSCLDDDTVIRLADGALDFDAAAHARGCAPCRDRIEAASRAKDATSSADAPTSASPNRPRRSAPEPSRGDPHLGRNVSRYVILSRLGAGAMGVVYAAYDPELDRKVAVKLLSTSAEDEGPDTARSRLLREAQAMARVSHPNVVAVLDVGPAEESVFLAMELVEGGTLRQWLETPRTWREVVTCFISAGKGLAAAHRAGVMHRDFKPDNVMIGNDGRVRVGDFGLSRAIAGEAAPNPTGLLSTSLTQTGTVMGTPGYMPPEASEGISNELGDQFSFCAALWRGLYKRLPYTGRSIHEMALAAERGELSEPPGASAVPARVRKALTRGLRYRPQDRFPSIDALVAELERATGVPQRRWLLASSAVALLLAVPGVGYALEVTRANRCGVEADRRANLWDEPRKEAIRQRFTASALEWVQQTSPRVEQGLDAWVDSWRAASNEACLAARVRGEQSEDVLALRRDCLDRRWQDFAALSDTLAKADAEVVSHAVDTVRGLRSVASCADVARLQANARPPAGALRAQVDEAWVGVASARALFESGKYDAAEQALATLEGRVRALGFVPLIAEVLVTRGQLAVERSDPAMAEEKLFEAVTLGESARLDDVAPRAWVLLVQKVIYERGRFAEATRYAQLAEGALARAGGDLSTEWQLHRALAGALYGVGRYGEALAKMQRALEVSNARFGAGSVEAAQCLMGLGMVQWKLGRHADAERNIRLAVETLRRAYGASHPIFGKALSSLAMPLTSMGRATQARLAFEEALRIGEAAGDPREVSEILVGLGWVMTGQGQLTEADAAFEKGIPELSQMRGSTHPELADAFYAIGELRLKQQRWKDAAATFTHAVTVLEQSGGLEHPDLADALLGLGRAQLELGNAADALTSLERAAKLYVQHPERRDPAARAVNELLLGRAQLAAHPVPRPR